MKRIALKTYQKSSVSNGDTPKILVQTTTQNNIQIFTSHGNMYTLACTDLPDSKPKDKGKPFSALMAGVDAGEEIVAIFSFDDYKKGDLFFATKSGLIKRTALGEYDVRNKKIIASGLSDGDSIISVHLLSSKTDWLVISSSGMSIRFSSSDVSAMGRSAKGVKAIALEKDSEAILASPIDDRDDVMIFTDLGYTKRSKASQFETQRRGGKGVKALTLQKNEATGSRVAAALVMQQTGIVHVLLNSSQHYEIESSQISCSGRTSKGTPAVLAVLGDYVETAYAAVSID